MILQIGIVLSLLCKLDADGVVSFEKKQTACCFENGKCCPEDTICDFKNKDCINSLTTINKFSQNSHINEAHYLNPVKISSRFPFILKKFEKQCSDSHFKCPGKKKCCPIENKGFGCCKFDKGVCCSDLKTCCPHGSECDVQKGVCTTKPSNITPLLKADAKEICPDKNIECSSSETCCFVGYNSYGCCPFKNATCCSDNITCCPHNKKCDLQKKLCVPKESMNVFSKERKGIIRVPEDGRLRNSYLDSTICQGNQTCCRIGEHILGCCPYAHGVCCPDRKTCCDRGYKCYGNGCTKAGV